MQPTCIIPCSAALSTACSLCASVSLHHKALYNAVQLGSGKEHRLLNTVNRRHAGEHCTDVQMANLRPLAAFPLVNLMGLPQKLQSA